MYVLEKSHWSQNHSCVHSFHFVRGISFARVVEREFVPYYETWQVLFPLPFVYCSIHLFLLFHVLDEKLVEFTTNVICSEYRYRLPISLFMSRYMSLSLNNTKETYRDQVQTWETVPYHPMYTGHLTDASVINSLHQRVYPTLCVCVYGSKSFNSEYNIFERKKRWYICEYTEQ